MVDWTDLIKSAVPSLVQGGLAYAGAKQQANAAQQGAAAATPTPWGTSSGMGQTTVDPRTQQINFNMAQNPFYQMMGQYAAGGLANAATAPGSYLYGASPELASAYQGLTSPDLTAAGTERYNLLTQLAAPEEGRSFNRLQDRLFARGQMGTTGGGIQQEAWQNAANTADLQRQLAGQDWAQTRAQNRFQAAQQAVGSGQQGARDQFMGAFQGMGGGMQQMWDQLLRQGQLGMGNFAMPGQVAMVNAEAQGTPWKALYGAIDQSGVIPAIGRGVFGSTPTAPPTGSGSAGGFVMPQIVPPMPNGGYGGQWGGTSVIGDQNMMYTS